MITATEITYLIVGLTLLGISTIVEKLAKEKAPWLFEDEDEEK